MLLYGTLLMIKSNFEILIISCARALLRVPKLSIRLGNNFENEKKKQFSDGLNYGLIHFSNCMFCKLTIL